MIEKRIAYKVILLGEKGVGKQTLTQNFATSVFAEDIRMTIGADFSVKSVDVDGRIVTLRIWDCACERRFRVLLPAFAKGADGALIIYDVTNRSTLAYIDDWLQVLKYFIESEQNRIPIIMVGNKTDLEDAREVSRDEGIEFAKSRGLDGYLECSFKSGKNALETFDTLIHLMLRQSNLLNVTY